jgi:hypothetical protein
MSHELFQISKASPETLNFLVAYGTAGVLGMLVFVGFLVWRGKRAGAGKPPVRSHGSRGNKSRKR